MSASRPPPSEFRRRFLNGERLIGTFVKTPTTHSIEILGEVGFDFVVIDEEHAPFDRGSIDVALLAARAAGTAGLVRIAEPTPAAILSALDAGSAGVLVPHVATAAMARGMASASRYRGGRRGFSNSPRAGRYGGLSMAEHIADADRTTTVIAMIEDPEALDVIDAIAATDGIDGFFIGRGDLAVALNAEGPEAPEVRSAVERVTAASRSVGKPVCVMVGGPADARSMRDLGATAFIVSSDQGFMRRAAAQSLADLSDLERSKA